MKWWRSKARNRYYRHDLRGLDSRVRARMRTRKQIRGLGFGLLAAMVLGVLSYGLWWVTDYSFRQLFSENEIYRIHDISIQSTGESLQRDQILSYLHLKANQNLLEVDLDRIRDEIELLPMVEHAEVLRELPARLVIRMVERVPVASISVSPSSTAYQIDRNGVVMDLVPYQRNPAEFQKKLDVLPRIMGVDIEDIKMGRAVTSKSVFQALALIQRLSQIEQDQRIFVKDVPVEIQTIDVSRSNMIHVTTTEGTVVKVGFGDREQSLRRLAAILDHVRRQSVRVLTIDLTVGRDVPVTLASNP